MSMLATRGGAVSMIGCTKPPGPRLCRAIQKRIVVPVCFSRSHLQHARGSRTVSVNASPTPSSGAGSELPRFGAEAPKYPLTSTGSGGSLPPGGRAGGSGGSSNSGAGPPGDSNATRKYLYFALAAALIFPVVMATRNALYPATTKKHGQILPDANKEELQRQKNIVESVARGAGKAGDATADAGQRVADSVSNAYGTSKDAVASAGHKVTDTVASGVDKAKHGAEKVGDKAMDAAESAQVRAQDRADAIKGKAGDVKHKAQDTGVVVAEASKEKADGLLAGIGAAVDNLRGMGAKAQKNKEATKLAVEDAVDSTLTTKLKHDWRRDVATTASGVALGVGVLALGYYIATKGVPENKGGRKPRIVD